MIPGSALHTEAGYCILVDPTPDGLAKKVGEAMCHGWGLAGGPFVVRVDIPAIQGIAVGGPSLMWHQAVYQVIQREATPEEIEQMRKAAPSPLIT
jgi:hypothetical protein